MDALTDLAACLAAIADHDLDTLRATIDAVPQTVPGLLAWLDTSVGWEQDRRAGHDYPLRGPHDAIPDDELVASTVAVEVMAREFRDDVEHDGKAIAALFDLVGAIIRVDAERTDSLQ